jgi:hypothetical protein
VVHEVAADEVVVVAQTRAALESESNKSRGTSSPPTASTTKRPRAWNRLPPSDATVTSVTRAALASVRSSCALACRTIRTLRALLSSARYFVPKRVGGLKRKTAPVVTSLSGSSA